MKYEILDQGNKMLEEINDLQYLRIAIKNKRLFDVIAEIQLKKLFDADEIISEVLDKLAAPLDKIIEEKIKEFERL